MSRFFSEKAESDLKAASCPKLPSWGAPAEQYQDVGTGWHQDLKLSSVFVQEPGLGGGYHQHPHVGDSSSYGLPWLISQPASPFS